MGNGLPHQSLAAYAQLRHPAIVRLYPINRSRLPMPLPMTQPPLLRFQAFSCLTHFPACVRPMCVHLCLYYYYCCCYRWHCVCGIEVSFRLNIDINCLLLHFFNAAACHHLNDVSPVVRHTRRVSVSSDLWYPKPIPNLSTPLN